MFFWKKRPGWRERDRMYRLLYETSRDALMLVIPEEGFIGANPACLALFGCKRHAEFVSRGPADFSPEFQPDGALSATKAQVMMSIAMRTGSHFFLWKHQRLDGSEFFANVLLTKMRLSGRDVLQATVRDMTTQKQAEYTERNPAVGAPAENVAPCES
jgi:PAS domain S-box-containing protein